MRATRCGRSGSRHNVSDASAASELPALAGESASCPEPAYDRSPERPRRDASWVDELLVGFAIAGDVQVNGVWGRLTRPPYRLQGDGTELVADLWPNGWTKPIACTPVEGLYVRMDAGLVMPLREYLEAAGLAPGSRPYGGRANDAERSGKEREGAPGKHHSEVPHL